MLQAIIQYIYTKTSYDMYGSGQTPRHQSVIPTIPVIH